MSDNPTDNKTRADSVRTTLGLLPMIALSAALTSPAQAQGVTELDTINVDGGAQGSASGYKRERLQSKKATAELKNTPKTVTVVPEQVIEERGATDLVEVLRNTPGISLDAGENGFSSGGNSVFIRGMNATGNVFTDGARDNGSYTRDTFNIEQVEVVKGAGGENGRSTGGGYINMATKTPTTENFIRGSTRIGFDDDGRTRTRGTVDVNRVVDSFAFRFNAMGEGGDIFGRDVADMKTWGVAPSLAYGLGTDFRAIFAYEHVRRDETPDNGVAYNRNPGEAGRPNVVAIPGAGPRGTSDSFLPRDTYFGAPTDYNDVESDAFLARFEYDFNDSITISNQTRWSSADRSSIYRIPSAGAALPGNQYYNRENTTLTNLTNVSAQFETGTWRHSLSAGLEFSRERADAIHGNPAVASPTTSEVGVDTVAAYLYDTIELNEQWLVNGGLRAERYSVDIRGSSGTTIPGATSNTFSDSRTTLSGNIGVVYKPRPEGSIYASYGLTHLPHGSLLSNPDISRGIDQAFPGFVAGAKPVVAHNYEVGVKWDFFNGDLSVTGALFRTEKKNVAYPFNPGGGADPYPVYGEQTVQGIEIGVAGSITSAWSVFGGLTLLDSERRHGADVEAALRQTGSGDHRNNPSASAPTHPDFPDHPNYDPALNEVTTRSGDELAFTPKFTANVWTTYDVTEKLTLGGGFQYVGDSWIGRPDDATRVIPNGKFGKLPGYFLVNLMASYAVNDNVTLRFNIDNVFNETYLTTTNWNGSWGYLGAPRTYRFGTSFKF